MMLRMGSISSVSIRAKASTIMWRLAVHHSSFCSNRTALISRRMEASFGSWEDQKSFQWKDFPTNADDVGAALHFLVETLDWVRAVKLRAVLTGEFAPVREAANCPVDSLRQERAEPDADQDVVLAGVHQISQLRPAWAQLLGHLAPGLAGMSAVGLVEGLPDRGGDDGVLAAGDVRQCGPYPVNAAALPVPATIDPLDRSLHASTFEHPGDGGLEAGVGRGGARNGPGDRFAAEG